MAPAADSPAEALPRLDSGFLTQLDRPFFSVLAAFMAVEFTAAIALAQRPRPLEIEDITLAQIPESTAKAWFPARPPTPPPSKPALAPALPQPAAPRPAPAPAPAPKPRSDKELRDELKHRGMMGILTAAGNPLEGVVGAAIGPVAIDRQVQDAVKDAHGHLAPGAAIEGPLGPKDTGPVTQTIGGVTTEGGTPAAFGPRHEPGAAPLPMPSVVIDHAEPPTAPGVDPQRISAFVRGQLGRVQACYEHVLKLHPGLHGRFVLRFVVGTDGRVVDADADEDELGSDDLERCLVDRLAKRWELPIRPAEETPVVYPFIFAPQAG